MAQLNLNASKNKFETSKDNIVIVNMLECSPVGGRVLNVDGFTPSQISAGHIIIRDKQGDKDYKPMPVNGNAYANLPSNHEIVGICYSSTLTSKPSVTIMVRGTVNEVASPYPVTEAIKKALPLIVFTQD